MVERCLMQRRGQAGRGACPAPRPRSMPPPCCDSSVATARWCCCAAGDKRADVAQRAFKKAFNKIVVDECGYL